MSLRLTLPIVLVGLPGSGKSKVGRRLARRLGVPHVDTDDLVEREAGRSITEIFADEGEPGFRVRETRAVEEALSMDAIVSVGGGAVTTPAVRDMLAGHCVVWVDAAHDELVRRTRTRTHRPLLRNDADATLRRLRIERQRWYDQVAAVRVTSDAAPPIRVVEEIMTHLDTVIEVGDTQAYPVVIGRGLGAEAVLEGVRADATRVLLVHPASVQGLADRLVAAAAARGLEVHALVHPDAEAGKTLEVAAACWEAAGTAHLGRTDVVVGLGGGATTDLAGFIAATWLRGVDVVQVPTTLLGMVDAAVGGKTGINTSAGKNLVGAFHAPVRVVDDLDALSTLASADLRAGLGEVLKCGFIADPAILQIAHDHPAACEDPTSPQLRELVERSVRVKASVVSQDPTESGPREILNYGHTLAHAIEKCEGYTWRHGDAVAVGCVFAAEIAHDLGLLDERDVDRHRQAFSAVGLPVSYAGGAPLSDLVEAMSADKKVRGDQLRFVLLEGLQHPQVQPVSPQALRGPAERLGIDVH